MLGLLKKDYLTNRFVFLVSLLVVSIAVILLSMKLTEASICIGIFGTILLPMLVNKCSSTEEMRKNYDIVMNSFPVKRSDVVLSRYIYYIIIYGVTAVTLSILVIKFNNLQGFDLRVILFIESILFLYYVLLIGVTNLIYYTCPYEFVAKYSTIIMMSIIYIPMIIFGLVTKVNPSIKENFSMILEENNPVYTKMIIVIALIGIVLYGVFVVVSMIGYNHKDLN